MASTAIQDQLHDNYCWGCGADNPVGLQLKTYWNGEVAAADWMPSLDFAAGPRHILNGGIIATLLDCHGVCTAIADAYQREDREIGQGQDIWHATVSISVSYRRPTPLSGPVQLTAGVPTRANGRTSVDCVLSSGGKERAYATVISTRVPEEWRHGSR